MFCVGWVDWSRWGVGWCIVIIVIIEEGWRGGGGRGFGIVGEDALWIVVIGLFLWSVEVILIFGGELWCGNVVVLVCVVGKWGGKVFNEDWKVYI